MNAVNKIYNNCIICDHNNWISIYNKQHIFAIQNSDFKFDQQLILCGNCGCTRVVFNDDYNDQNLTRYYKLALRTPVNLESISEDKSDPRVLNASKRADFIDENTNGKRLLEIGFGDGFTLLESQKRGYLSTGIDLTGDYVENITYLKKVGVEICNQDFIDYKVDERYEIISAFLLMEHIKDPSAFLNKVNNHLVENGYFIVEVPDVNNYKNFYSESQMTFEHIYHYTIDTLELLLNKEGFTLVNYSSPGAGYPFALTASFQKVSNLKSKVLRPNLAERIRNEFKLYFSRMKSYRQEINLVFHNIINSHGQIVVFGAGNYFDTILEIVGEEMLQFVTYFIDETTEKIGTEHHGKKINDISVLSKDRPHAVLIASEIFAIQIRARIIDLSPNTKFYCIQNEVLNNLKTTIS